MEIISGIILGLLWEYFGTGKKPGDKSLVPSLFIKISKRKIHFHHWIVYLFGAFIFFIIYCQTQESILLSPISFLIIGTIYDILHYSDWYKFW